MTATRRATPSPRAHCAPSDGAQRGSVMDMPVYPGDPLTPGVGATKDAKRLAIERRQDPHHHSGACRFLTATPSRCWPR